MLQWWIQGRVLGGLPPSPYFWTKPRPTGPKKLGGRSGLPPLFQGLDLALCCFSGGRQSGRLFRALCDKEIAELLSFCKWSRNSRGRLLQYLGKGNDGKEREKKEMGNVICQTSHTFLLPFSPSTHVSHASLVILMRRQKEMTCDKAGISLLFWLYQPR